MTGARKSSSTFIRNTAATAPRMVANVVRYRARSALRDIGKALGLSETALDRVAKFLSSYENVRPQMLEQIGLNASRGLHEHLLAAHQ